MNPLRLDTIHHGLRGSIFQGKIRYLARTGSTNDDAFRLAAAGEQDETVLIADFQERGKGRSGRTWTAPPNSAVLLSIIFRHVLPITKVQYVNAVCAISAAKVVSEMCGTKAGIKPPNDIVLNGKKICGILCESRLVGHSVDFVIGGIGLNVNLVAGDFPEDLQYPATSMRMEIGREVERESVVVRLLKEIEKQYTMLKNSEYVQLNHSWKEHSAVCGKSVTIWANENEYAGTVEDVDLEAGIVLRQENGFLVSIRNETLEKLRIVEK